MRSFCSWRASRAPRDQFEVMQEVRLQGADAVSDCRLEVSSSRANRLRYSPVLLQFEKVTLVSTSKAGIPVWLSRTRVSAFEIHSTRDKMYGVLCFRI